MGIQSIEMVWREFDFIADLIGTLLTLLLICFMCIQSVIFLLEIDPKIDDSKSHR